MSYESLPLERALDDSRPTSVRWGVLGFLSTLALLLYLDRVCFGQAVKAISADLNLGKDQIAWAMNAFALAYCVFEVPTGHLADKYGSRGIIARIVICWSIFTALTGAVMGLPSLVAMRFLFGVGEAGAFPNVALVITKWFPLEDRGKARGIVTTVSMLGGGLSPILAAYLIGVVGWRWMFGLFGLVGLVWAAVFYWWFRDVPQEHPQCNAAEAELIGTHALDTAIHGMQERIPWGIVLTSPNMWLMGCIMMCSASLFYMQFQWIPSYLKEVWKLEDLNVGWCTSAVMIGGGLGCLSGGMLVDLIMRTTRDRKWSRRALAGGSLALAALSSLGVRYAQSVELATLCNVSALFFVQLAVPTWWTVVAEISGKHGASMWGLMNSMGGAGVIGTTYLIGKFLAAGEKASETPLVRWTPVFDCVAGLLVIGAILWVLVDPTRSIVERRHDLES